MSAWFPKYKDGVCCNCTDMPSPCACDDGGGSGDYEVVPTGNTREMYSELCGLSVPMSYLGRGDAKYKSIALEAELQETGTASDPLNASIGHSSSYVFTAGYEYEWNPTASGAVELCLGNVSFHGASSYGATLTRGLNGEEACVSHASASDEPGFALWVDVEFSEDQCLAGTLPLFVLFYEPGRLGSSFGRGQYEEECCIGCEPTDCTWANAEEMTLQWFDETTANYSGSQTVNFMSSNEGYEGTATAEAEASLTVGGETSAEDMWAYLNHHAEWDTLEIPAAAARYSEANYYELKESRVTFELVGDPPAGAVTVHYALWHRPYGATTGGYLQWLSVPVGQEFYIQAEEGWEVSLHQFYWEESE